MLAGQAIFGKSPHPFLAHVTQTLVPQLTRIVGYNIHFLPAYPGMHQVQCVDLTGSGHDQAPFAELHDSILDATRVALNIQPTD